MLRSPVPASSRRKYKENLCRSRVVEVNRTGKGAHHQQQQEEGEGNVINDENNRRLSNGSVATSPASLVGHGTIVSCSGGTPLKFPSPASTSWSSPSVMSPASPTCVDRRSLVGAVNERGGSGSEEGSFASSLSSSSSSSSSSTASESLWSPGSRGSDDLSGELIPVVGETQILSPTVHPILSRISSVTTEGDRGIDIDLDLDGDGDGVARAAGDNGSDTITKSQPGGSGEHNGSMNSTGSSSVGDITGLNGVRFGRPASRREAAVKKQHRQPQSTVQGGQKKYFVRTRWGGWREVEGGTPAVAKASYHNSSRPVMATKSGEPPKKNVTGVDPDDKQRTVGATMKAGPCTGVGTTSAMTRYRDTKKRNPTTPSPKKPLATAASTTTITTIATKSKSRKQPPKGVVKLDEHRPPLYNPIKTRKAKPPLTNGATKEDTTSKPPRATGTASKDGEGMSGGGRSSPSKRPTPRVSASGHMAWERTLRTMSTITSKKNGKSPPAKKDKVRRAMRKACKGSGGGGGGGDGGDGKDGRPSLGTWDRAQHMLKMLKELTGTDDEELQWLAVAKEGKGVEKSEKRQESAETEYHRLLYEESMQQLEMKLLKDRRLELALKAFGKLGIELERQSERLEELGQKEMTLIAEDEEAERQASIEVDAAKAVQEAKTAEAAVEASLDDDEPAGASRTATEAVAAAAETSTASRHEQRERLEQEKGQAEEDLGRLLEDIATGKEKIRALGAVLRVECRQLPCDGGRALETVVGITADVGSARELIAPARAKSGLHGLEDAAKTLEEQINKTRSDSQSALARMEKWRERKEALPEYEKEIAEREKAWFEREAAANEEALRRTRALLPVGVTGLTVAQLEQRAIEAGSLYPRELALRLKENRLLHWTVTHPDDIARSNFLRGDHAHFFTNLDQYDLVELRAVLACLPAKFEVDGDGRKAAWRATFLQRVQGLVAQERGDTVSGGWDPELQARRQVQLPKLTEGQTRRKEYYYPTATEVEQKIHKLHERRRRLEAKQTKLALVRDELLPEAKEEYANVLEDTRHPANKEAFKPEDLRRARDEAKAEVERLSKEARRLEGDVASAQRALRESPYTVEFLQAEAEATRCLLTERARKARFLARQQQQQKEQDEGLQVGEGLEVEGAFDPTPELKSRFADKTSSLRFVTAEEDARMRREELASVFAVRNKTASQESSSEEGSGGSSEEEAGKSHADGAVADDAGEGQGTTKGRMKAFGAILEKTLSQNMLGRLPTSGSVAAGAAASVGVGGKMRVLVSPSRRQQQSENKGPAIVAPPCKPKSKFFRSIRSPPGGSNMNDNGNGNAGGTGRPLIPPPPPPAPMTGLLAQIRAQGGGLSSGGSGVDGDMGATSVLREEGDSSIAPPSLPQPPAPSLPLKSLFAATGASTAGAPQGPPSDFFAQLRAKAAEKQALRRVAEAEIDN
eukprot:g12593.t1